MVDETNAMHDDRDPYVANRHIYDINRCIYDINTIVISICAITITTFYSYGLWNDDLCAINETNTKKYDNHCFF